jgi:hypothetical protein
MFTRTDKEPDPKAAIEFADELWTLLEKKFKK